MLVPERFFALRLEPGRTYANVVDQSFKISMAALAGTSTKKEKVSVSIIYDEQEFVICNLFPVSKEQQTLELVFTEGEEITFKNKGSEPVDLTGNYVRDEEMDNGMEAGMFDSDDEEVESIDDEDMEDIEEEVNEVELEKEEVSAKVTIKKQKVDEKKIVEKKAVEKTDAKNVVEEVKKDVVKDATKPEVVKLTKAEKKKLAQQKKLESAAAVETEKVSQTLVKKVAVEGVPSSENKKTNEKVAASPKVAATPKVAESPKVSGTPKESAKSTKAVESPASTKKTLPSGLVIEDIVVGDGPKAKKGKKISARYIGKRAKDGKVFDSNTKGKPFSFRLGAGDVIKGWDIGFEGMQVGGTRKITIPANLAYGARGAPPDIPPNSVLEFEVKLLEVK